MSDNSETKVARRAPLILENHLKLEEFARRSWTYQAPAGSLPEDFLRPEAWANVSSRVVRTLDHVEIMCEDSSWWAEYLVRQCKDGMSLETATITIAMLHRRDFNEIVFTGALYRVTYKGPSVRWCVIRKSDDKVMSSGHQVREIAEAWLKDNLEPLAAAA